MCKYCTSQFEGLCENLIHTSMRIGEDRATIDSAVYIDLLGKPNLYVDLEIGCETIFVKTKSINYCPMCGRKLESEE
jgi:hypothetical protein